MVRGIAHFKRHLVVIHRVLVARDADDHGVKSVQHLVVGALAEIGVPGRAAEGHDAAPGAIKGVVDALFAVGAGEAAGFDIAVQVETFGDVAGDLLHAGIGRGEGIDVAVDVAAEAAMLHGGRDHLFAFAAGRDGQGELVHLFLGAPTGLEHRLVIQDGNRALGAIGARLFGAGAAAVIKSRFVIIHDKAADRWRGHGRADGQRQDGMPGWGTSAGSWVRIITDPPGPVPSRIHAAPHKALRQLVPSRACPIFAPPCDAGRNN